MWPKPKEGIGTAQNKTPLQSVVYQVVPPRYVVEGGAFEAVSDGTRSSSRDDISDSEEDLAVHGKTQIPSAPASMGSTGLKHARSQRSSAQTSSSTFKTFRKTSNPDTSKHRTPLEQRLTFSPSIPAFELVDLASPATDPVNPFATTHTPPTRTTPRDHMSHKMVESTSAVASLSGPSRPPLDPLSANSHASTPHATYEVDSVVDLASSARSAFGTQGSGSRLAIDRISMDSDRYNPYATDKGHPASSRSDSASNAFQSAPLAFKVTKYSPLSARRRHFSNAPKYRSISYMKEHKIDPEAQRTEKPPHYRPFSYSSEATFSEPSTELGPAALASAPTSPRVAKPSGTGFHSNPVSHFAKAFQHTRIPSHGSNRTSSTSSSIPSTHSPAPAEPTEFSRISASRSPPPKRKRRYSTSAIDDVIDGEGNAEPLHELTDGDEWHPSTVTPARHVARTGRLHPVTQASDDSSDFSAQMVPYEYDDWAHVEHRNSDSDSDPSTHSVSSFHHQRNRRSRRVSLDADTESTGYQTAVMDTDSAGDDRLGSSPESILGTHLTSTRSVVAIDPPLSGRRRRGAMTNREFRPGLGSVSDSATDSAGEVSDLGSMTAEFDSSELTSTDPTNSSVTSSAASTASSIPSIVSANSTQSVNSVRSLGSARSNASITSSDSDRKSAAPVFSALAEGQKKNRSTSHEILPVEIDVRRESKRRRRSEDAASVIHGNNPPRSNAQQSHASLQHSMPALQPSVQSMQPINQFSSPTSFQASNQFQAPSFSMSEGNLASDASQTFSGRIKVRSPRRTENHHLGSPISTGSIFSSPSSSTTAGLTSGSSSTTVGTSHSSHSSGSSSHLIKPASDIAMALQSTDGTTLKWTPRAPVLPATEITLPKWASTGSVVPTRSTSSAAMTSLSSPTLKNMSPRSSHTDEETKTPLRKRTSGASVLSASTSSQSNSNLSMKHSGGTPMAVSPHQVPKRLSTSTGSQLNLGGLSSQNFPSLQEELQIAFPIPLNKLNGRRSRRIFTSSIKDGGEETDGVSQPPQSLQPRQPNMVGIVDACDSDTSYSADVDNDEDEESAFASAYDPSSGPALLDPYHLRPRGGVTPKPNPKPTRLLRDAQLSERSTGSPGLAPMLSNLPANFQTILFPRYQGAAGRTIAQRMAEGQSQEYASDTAIMNDPPQERGPRMGVGYVTDDDFCYQPPIVGHADFLVAMPMLQQQSAHYTSTMNPSSSNISIEAISSRAPMSGVLASTSEIYAHASQVTPSNIGLQDIIPSGLRASVSSTSMDSSTAMLGDIHVSSVEPPRGGRSDSCVMKSTVHLVQTYQNIQRAINERNELEQAGTRQKAGAAPYYYPKIDEIVGGGRYKVLGYLGRGSFGVVVKAEVLPLPNSSSDSSAMSSDGDMEDGDDASTQQYGQSKSPAASSALIGNEMDTSSHSETSSHLKPRSVVAIKIGRKGASFLQQGRCEVSILERIHQFQAKQPNNDLDLFVQPLDTFFHNEHLCIVFELLADSLFDLVKYSWEVRPERPGLSLRMVRKMTHQILCALVTLKNLKIIHSDLKPENIALAQPNRPRLKLLDFGSSCFIADSHLNQFPYIQSRYYRAPEVLLGTGYSCSIDMWSLGCIIAELYLGRPIFEGSNSVTQLYCIIEVLGMPTDHVLRNAVHLNRYFHRVGVDDQGHTVLDPVVKNHPFNSTSLKEIIATKKEPNNPLHLQYFTDLIARMLDWDPNNRITPIEAINHNFILYGPKTSPDGT